MHISEESQLISSILDGDTQAYAILVNRYQRPIYNSILRMTGCRETAADLAQDAFLKAYEHLERFKLSEKFFPWLYAIALNLVKDRWRRQKIATENLEQIRQTDGHLTEDPLLSQSRLAEQLDAGRLHNDLMRLPQEYREALILRFHEGLGMKDIGKALGISTSGAKMRISRGIEKLRSIFQRGGSDKEPWK
jgi:RNA polymerase sigma-70 factor (ECF subfamily)